MDLWNQKDLPSPPVLSFKAESKNIDLNKFRRTIIDALKHFKSKNFLAREAAILARTIYRMKMKFRNSKEFKTLEKINRALKNYYSVNVVRDLKQFLDLLPREYDDESTYLPTKNMLCYILIRLQGLAKVMTRIYDSCEIAADLFKKRLLVGHFWKIAIIAYAMVSRIFILVKFCTKFICDTYGKLYSYLSCLKNPGVEWLPEGYVLPADLREWLNVAWVYEEDYVDLTFEPAPKIFDFFDLCGDNEDVLFCDEYILINDDDEVVQNRGRKPRLLREDLISGIRGFNTDNDFGEPIEITDTEDTDLILYKPEDGNHEIIAAPVDIGEVIEIHSADNECQLGAMEQIETSSPGVVFENVISGNIGNEIVNEIVILDQTSLNPNEKHLAIAKLSDQTQESQLHITDENQEMLSKEKTKSKNKTLSLNKNKTGNFKQERNIFQVNMNHRRKIRGKLSTKVNHSNTARNNVKGVCNWKIVTSTPLSKGVQVENVIEDKPEISVIKKNTPFKFKKKRNKKGRGKTSTDVDTKKAKKTHKIRINKITNTTTDIEQTSKNNKILKSADSSFKIDVTETNKDTDIQKLRPATKQKKNVRKKLQKNNVANIYMDTSNFNSPIPSCSKKIRNRQRKSFGNQTKKSGINYSDSDISSKWESNSYFKHSTLRLGSSIEYSNCPSLILINSTDDNLMKNNKISRASKNINDIRKKTTSKKVLIKRKAELNKNKSNGRKLKPKNVSQDQSVFVVSLTSSKPSLSSSPSQQKSVETNFCNTIGRKRTRLEQRPISDRLGNKRQKM
ncbi:uncharacterized protein LOC132703674 [Cylas formicarius]|uniref:uncharacterized protein LOC132703674 n=1 Tax=Cylas formicarius TaxID=197179 RepID=UPI0029587F73|nr:uncharacterized protein LOC132703674 [Cylas formicarius]XP_060529061.1 uncharacterized protein LOC132703674 [Cylas formicarius]